MEIAGYIASILIGLSLGLIGGGGSILTVPVLVYLFGVNPTVATSYSLFIVGSTSLIGAIRKYAIGQVSMKTAQLFGITSVITVLLTRRYIIPAIPENLGMVGGIILTKSMLTMVLFAILMLLASVSMIRGRKDAEEKEKPIDVVPLMMYGVGIGLVTGLLGAGGGFLIIPALVLLARLPMKLAVGTSLTIIAIKSLIGFMGDIQTGQVIDWGFLLFFTALAVGGIFIGGYVSNYIPGKKLKSGFGWFVLFMSIFILTKELLFQ